MFHRSNPPGPTRQLPGIDEPLHSAPRVAPQLLCDAAIVTPEPVRPRMDRMWRALVVMSGLLLAGGATARTSGPPPCPGVRLLSDRALLGGPESFDAFTVDGAGQVTIEGSCGAVLGRWRNRR